VTVSAAALREAFDRSFALPRKMAEPLEDFLGLRLGGEAYAVSLAEVASVHRRLRVVPLLHDAPHRLGLCALRGALVPVFELGSLLGYPRQPSEVIVLAKSVSPVAFAIAQLEGHLRVRAGDLVRLEDRPASPYLHQALLMGGLRRPVIRLASVVEAFRPKEGAR
jgi:chemotaxis signal transduction protein